MRWILAAMASCAVASVARAADKPLVGPPAVWVRELPPTPAPAKGSEGAAVAVLQQDTQFRFDAAGQSQYDASQFRVQSAQGLAALGTIAMNWAPATDTLTVHRLRILRGAQVIDLLPKDGVFTVVRRETQLETASVVNGVLTAVVQPEGLQVGDVLDIAYTLRREDPFLRGRADAFALMAPAVPIAHARIAASWPSALGVAWKAADGMAAPTLSREAGGTAAVVDLQDVRPQPVPEGAPPRFRIGRQLMFSNYASWADVGALMEPLYVEAARLPPGSPVLAEAKAIAARTADPAARASAALALVQDQVRYLALVAGELGLKPAAADVTWSRRYGDCKGKTVLLLALLRELGIKAEPVLASSTLGDGLDGRLPSASVFDHVLVRARVGGRDYWLDGTRIGDRDLASVSTPAFGYVLPVRAAGAALVHLAPEPAKAPLSRTVVRIDASQGIDKPAPFHVEASVRGDDATKLKLQLANLAPDDLDRALKAYWRNQYDSVTPSRVAAAFDPKVGEERLTMDGDATMDWSGGGYEADGAVIGWRFDPHRDPGPHADAPFAVSFPGFTQTEETIVLPKGGEGFTIWGENVDRELAGYAFHRKAAITGSEFRLETSVRALTPEITLAQAQKDAPAVTELGKGTLRLRSPKDTQQARLDRQALLTTEPVGRDGYIARGGAFLDERRFAEALKDFDRAVSLDPGSAEAVAGRGLALAWLGRSAAAKADLDHAETLDPAQVVVWRARGLLAQTAGDGPAAIAAYSRALELQPGDVFALMRRADVYAAGRDFPRALADLDAALKAAGDNPAIHAAKAETYGRMGDLARLRSESALARFPNQSEDDIRIDLLDRLWRTGHKPEARAEADRMIAAAPTAELYLRRSAFRERGDLAGVEADAKAALALDPKSYAAAATLANVRFKAKDLAAARVYAEQAAAAAPDQASAQLAVAPVVAKAAGAEVAARTLARTRALIADDPVALNSLCYALGVNGVQLEGALADCDRSLTLKPGVGATLDSRGFVLLRLNRDKDAIAAYDAALAAEPGLADSLWGRGVAERRLGLGAAAERDIAAAKAKDAKVRERFEAYGVAD